MRAITRALALANIRASKGIEDDEKIKRLSDSMRVQFYSRVKKNPAREKQYLDAKERRKQIVSMKLDEIIGAAKEEVQDRMFDRDDTKGKKYKAVPLSGKGRSYNFGAKGYTMAPGTPKGDNYCARSSGIKSGRISANSFARWAWNCRGKKSLKR